MNATPALQALHADEWLLALDKPAGLLAVPGRGEDKQDCLWHRARRTWPDALVVHRLDMATSGVMVFARGAATQRRLSWAFEQRQPLKHYEAVVHGLLGDDLGRIDLPLAADWPNRPRQQVNTQRGKPSLTEWRVLSRDAATQRTRVELKPHTGRTHQLRVHLQAIGHPIVGDTLYAPPEVADAAPRLLLHASALRINHPEHGTPLDLRCAVPF